MMIILSTCSYLNEGTHLQAMDDLGSDFVCFENKFTGEDEEDGAEGEEEEEEEEEDRKRRRRNTLAPFSCLCQGKLRNRLTRPFSW